MRTLIPLRLLAIPRVYAPSWTLPILDALVPLAWGGDAVAHRVLGWWTAMRDDSIRGMPPDPDEWFRWADTGLTMLGVEA